MRYLGGMVVVALFAAPLNAQSQSRPVLDVPVPVPGLLRSHQVELGKFGDAGEIIEFSKAGLWHIEIVEELNGGCYATAFFEHGEAIRVGKDPTTENQMFGISKHVSAWQDGDVRPIEIRIGHNRVWNSWGSVHYNSEGPLIYVTVDKSNLLEELASSDKVSIYYDSQELGDFIYEDFSKVAIELERCEAFVDQRTDLFSRPPAVDPGRR